LSKSDAIILFRRLKGGLNRHMCVFDTSSNVRSFKKKTVAEVADVL